MDAAAGLTTIAPGSYVSIYGGGFTSDLAGSYDEFNLVCPNGLYCPYPLSFDYVTVSFDVSGASYPGFPYFISAGQYPQVNLLVPWELEGQSSAKVKVSFDLRPVQQRGDRAHWPRISPAFLLSCGAACALDYPGYNLISTSNPAKRGQIIQLFANGLGPVTNPPGDGVAATASPLSQTPTTPIIMIGGAQANVSFSGLAPGYPALYQINVTVPQGAQTGNAVPISIQIGGATSPAATIPVQ